MSISGDDTLDHDGTLAGAAAGDDELSRPVDVAPPPVPEPEDEDTGEGLDGEGV
jgi:hypothetical protein